MKLRVGSMKSFKKLANLWPESSRRKDRGLKVRNEREVKTDTSEKQTIIIHYCEKL